MERWREWRFIFLGAGSASSCLLLASAASAQRTPSGADDVAGLAACAGCGTAAIVIPIAIIVLNFALLIWVARDAKSRGMDNAVLWMVLVMVLSFIGLILYFFSRPKGQLIQCPHCSNSRLAASAKCPHCGNA